MLKSFVPEITALSPFRVGRVAALVVAAAFGLSLLNLATAAADDPPDRPPVPMTMQPSFPAEGTPGFMQWQGAISSAREYVQVKNQKLTPGGTLRVSYSYEYHGAALGVLCAPTDATCHVTPHAPAPAPDYQIGGEWAFLGSSNDSQAYGKHTDQDVAVPEGPTLARLRVPSGSITEEVGVTTNRSGNFADVWFTVVREATLTFTLPTTLPSGPLYFGLNDHPALAMSLFGGAHLTDTSSYRSGPYETAAWWTDGALINVRDPGAAPIVPNIYVALGDSYSAGEGLAPYFADSHTKKDTCHRSKTQAYSRVYRTGFKKSFHACSQVKLAAWFDNSQKSHEPAQRGYLNARTALATMTLGGNNLDWSSLLITCTRVEEEVTHRLVHADAKACQKALDAVPTKITAMVKGKTVDGVRQKGLEDVYRDALTQAPNASIKVLGYPTLFPDRGDREAGCRIARLHPFQLVLSAVTERQVVTLQDEVNDAIRDGVNRVRAEQPNNSRLHYVDVTTAFGGAKGHTISCGDTKRPTPWINAVRLSAKATAKLAYDFRHGNYGWLKTGAFTVYSASFHPTKRGQQAMASVL